MHFLKGEATATLDDDRIDVGPGAWIHMTAGLRHKHPHAHAGRDASSPVEIRLAASCAVLTHLTGQIRTLTIAAAMSDTHRRQTAGAECSMML
jgi:hypothetical protein